MFAIVLPSLHKIMVLSEKVSNDHKLALRLAQDIKNINRIYAIEWLKKVLSKDHGAIETSIQVFDKFMLYAYNEDATVITNTTFLSYTAACSAIIGVKLTNTKSAISVASFSSFDSHKLIELERKMLMVIMGKIYPLNTPSNFVVMIVAECPTQKSVELVHTAKLLIAEFEENVEYLLYAPSTVAISALLIAFSLHHMNCNEWLECLPDFCLPTPEGNHSQPELLDIDSCIIHFEKIPLLRNVPSPTGIEDGF